jgi:hypothetical protein
VQQFKYDFSACIYVMTQYILFDIASPFAIAYSICYRIFHLLLHTLFVIYNGFRYLIRYRSLLFIVSIVFPSLLIVPDAFHRFSIALIASIASIALPFVSITSYRTKRFPFASISFSFAIHALFAIDYANRQRIFRWSATSS